MYDGINKMHMCSTHLSIMCLPLTCNTDMTPTHTLPFEGPGKHYNGFVVNGYSSSEPIVSGSHLHRVQLTWFEFARALIGKRNINASGVYLRAK